MLITYPCDAKSKTGKGTDVNIAKDTEDTDLHTCDLSKYCSSKSQVYFQGAAPGIYIFYSMVTKRKSVLMKGHCIAQLLLCVTSWAPFTSYSL